jgi:hypothetical protein
VPVEHRCMYATMYATVDLPGVYPVYPVNPDFKIGSMVNFFLEKIQSLHLDALIERIRLQG